MRQITLSALTLAAIAIVVFYAAPLTAAESAAVTADGNLAPATAANDFQAAQNESARQQQELLRTESSSPFVSEKAETVADLQTVQNLSQPLVPATRGDRLTPPPAEIFQASGLVPAEAGIAQGRVNVGASTNTSIAAPAQPVSTLVPPLVSTEGQMVTAGSGVAVTAPPAPSEQAVVGTLVSVDEQRSEITIRDQLSGRNVTLSATAAEWGDLERGTEVRAVFSPGTNRATRVDLQAGR